MFSKVRTKIVVLIALIGALLLLVFYVDWRSQTNHAAALIQERRAEKSALLEKALAVSSRNLVTFAHDYSVWDEMVRFVREGDTTWARENIDAGIPTYNVQAAWVCTSDLKVVYSYNTLGDTTLSDPPLSSAELVAAVQQDPMGHFFTMTPAGPMEICTGPIQPSSDIQRKTSPQGYLIAGRLWSKAYIDELAILTSSFLCIHDLGESCEEDSLISRDEFVVQCTQKLKHWDGTSLCEICAVSEYPAMRDSFALLRRQFAESLIFAVLVLGAISFILLRYVSTPLGQISAALSTGDPRAVSSLEDDPTEFGRISSLIRSFFSQKSSLENEIRQRAAAERETRRSLSLVKATLESTADGILVVDGDGKVMSYNRRFLELWRIPESLAEAGDGGALLRSIVSQLSDPETFMERVEQLQKQPDKEGSDLVEFQDGRYFERYSRPQCLGEDVVGRVWSFRDVSERVRADKALRESESRFRSLSDNAPVLIWMSGVDRHCYFFNRRWFAFTGRSIEQEYGRGWLKGVHPDDLEKCLSVYRTAFMARLPYSAQFRLLHADGTYHWVYDTATPRYGENGAFAGYMGTFTDVSDRKDTEEALRESDERFRTLFETAQDGIFFKDRDRVYRQLNEATAAAFNWRREQMVGVKDEDLFDEETASHIQESDRRVLKGVVVEEENRYRSHGVERVFHIVKTPMRDKAGAVVGICGIARDITERRRKEVAVRKFELLCDASADFIAMTGMDGSFTYVNPAGLEMIGYRSLGEIMRTPVADLVPTEWHDFFKQTLERARNGQRWDGVGFFRHRFSEAQIRLLIHVIGITHPVTGEVMAVAISGREANPVAADGFVSAETLNPIDGTNGNGSERKHRISQLCTEIESFLGASGKLSSPEDPAPSNHE